MNNLIKHITAISNCKAFHIRYCYHLLKSYNDTDWKDYDYDIDDRNYYKIHIHSNDIFTLYLTKWKMII